MLLGGSAPERVLGGWATLCEHSFCPDIFSQGGGLMHSHMPGPYGALLGGLGDWCWVGTSGVQHGLWEECGDERPGSGPIFRHRPELVVT